MTSLTGIEAERRIHRRVLDGQTGADVLELLLPDGKPHDYETSLWDYKRCFPDTSGRGQDSDKRAIEELVKDVSAFHNTFGGYIVCGIDHLSANALVGCAATAAYRFTVEKLNEQVKRYTGKTINCRFSRIDVADEKGEVVHLGLLAIPMRAPEEPVVRFSRGCSEDGKAPAFRKGDIFARVDDTCIPALGNTQAIQLLCSSRQYGEILARRELEHNLPPRDPNLIKFIGRSDYLLQLWSWQLERHNPVKVLTALGGTGKTAIAYEFCLQTLSNPPAQLQKVIWLSAKKQSFSAIQGRWYSVTRVDFTSVNDFLEALAREIGIMESEIKEANGDREELLDLVLGGLEEFPSFVVVDDVDTLEIEEQNNLFATVQPLAGRSFERGTRFLFTSRLEFGADSQRIQVLGFEETEFREYAKTVAARLEVAINDATISQLHKASRGSPVFASSILSLASLGFEIHQAIKQWKGKAGEDVRRFAFEREIDQLTESQARTLFALTTLGQTTLLELSQILEVDSPALIADLAKLREFHLFASRDNPGTGARLEVPEPIILMRDVLATRITDPRRIERDCLRARSQAPRVQDKIAAAIGGVVALWQADEYDDALIVAKGAAEANPKSGDLWCVLGQSYLKLNPAKPAEADKAFSKAWKNQCRRPELVSNWMQAKALAGDWVGIPDLAHQIPPSDLRDRMAYLTVLAEAELGQQAVARGDPNRASARFKAAMENASKTLGQGRAGEALPEIREMCRQTARRYISVVDRACERAGDRITVFNAVHDAFACHVSESQLLRLGSESLKSWANDVFTRADRDPEALLILRRKLDQLQEMISLVRKQENRAVDLIDKLVSTREDLDAKLRRALARQRRLSA